MSENQDLSIPLDINKVVTDLISNLTTSTASSAFSKGKGWFKSFSDDVRLKFESSYREYLISVYQRYLKAKSFLIRDEITELYDFYIPQGISCDKKNVKEASIFNFTVKNRFAVIRGSAGSGKSMMMRHLFLNTIEKKEAVPIFIELRKINDFEGNLLDFVKTTLKENKFTLDDDYIEKALKAGHFALFLDGFDEISLSKRKQLIKEIYKLAQTYDRNIIIISSRPDDEFTSWSNVDVWDIEPLTLFQALNLVKKVPAKNIDAEIRDKFLKDLERELFKKHESFLSNPLLLSIMTITYANSGDVPHKISTFYENAYIALFERHDALKGAFKRDRKCGLDILDFKKIFSSFSALSSNNLLTDTTYSVSSNSLRFPKTDALDFINKAKVITDTSIDFNSEDYLHDCIKAVCLLLEDGLEIAFAHRSFQEYFTALFISGLDDSETQKELISSYLLSPYNRTIEILFEINPSLIEKLILMPCIERLENEIGFNGKVTSIIYKNYLKFAFKGVFIESHLVGDRPRVMVALKQSRDREINLINHAYSFIYRNYLIDTRTMTFVSPKGSKEISPLLENSKLNLTINQLIKDQNLFKILETDKIWGRSRHHLEAVLKTKEILLEKHKQITAARKANFLEVLRKKI